MKDVCEMEGCELRATTSTRHGDHCSDCAMRKITIGINQAVNSVPYGYLTMRPDWFIDRQHETAMALIGH